MPTRIAVGVTRTAVGPCRSVIALTGPLSDRDVIGLSANFLEFGEAAGAEGSYHVGLGRGNL
jgi:hypothetical protein